MLRCEKRFMVSVVDGQTKILSKKCIFIRIGRRTECQSNLHHISISDIHRTFVLSIYNISFRSRLLMIGFHSNNTVNRSDRMII